MFSYIHNFEGVMYTIYFFAGFSGYNHPWSPSSPLDIYSIHDPEAKTYYRAWYSEENNTPRLDKLHKYMLISKEIPAPDNIDMSPGIRFRKIQLIDNNWEIGINLKPEEVLNEKHYYLYEVDSNNELVRSVHYFSSILDDIEYSYTHDGAYKDKDIKLEKISKLKEESGMYEAP